MSDRRKVLIWVDIELADRIARVARRGDKTNWATAGLEQGVSEREQELIEKAQRNQMLSKINIEKAS